MTGELQICSLVYNSEVSNLYWNSMHFYFFQINPIKFYLWWKVIVRVTYIIYMYVGLPISTADLQALFSCKEKKMCTRNDLWYTKENYHLNALKKNMYLLHCYKIAIKFDLCAKLKITCTCCSLIFSEKHSVRCPDGTHLACFKSLLDIATSSI